MYIGPYLLFFAFIIPRSCANCNMANCKKYTTKNYSKGRFLRYCTKTLFTTSYFYDIMNLLLWFKFPFWASCGAFFIFCAKPLAFFRGLWYNTLVDERSAFPYDSKTNRLRHSLFLKTLAAPGFYGIEALRKQVVGMQFSIKIPTTKYLEKYSSGRRGVTRNLVGR